jgi:putative endonuclease
MSYFVYIIYSKKLNKYYVGYSENIILRLQQHNEGISIFTSKANDWKLVYHEPFATRQEAQKREKAIKAKKSRRYIEWLIGSAK